MRLMAVMQDERGFVHKRFFGAAKGFLGGGPLGAVSGFLAGGGGGGFLERQAAATAAAFAREQALGRTLPAPTPIRPPAFVPTTIAPINLIPSIPDLIQATRDLVFPGKGGPVIPGLPSGFSGNGGTCPPPGRFVGEICVQPGTPAGPPGEAVMGRFGAALEPTFLTINKRVCLPGMVLGKPDVGGLPLCYNIGAISNKERLWPKGAAPLLTGGEMSAIRKAATAAGKFQRAGKRLAAVGKTFSGPAGRRAPAKRLTAGRTVKVLESGPGSVQL